jgi:hypothetical protein
LDRSSRHRATVWCWDGTVIHFDCPHDPDAAFDELVSGLPKIAAPIVHLPAASREIALQAVERSYYELALGWGYPEMRAKRWATLVMVALQRAIEDQTPF